MWLSWMRGFRVGDVVHRSIAGAEAPAAEQLRRRTSHGAPTAARDDSQLPIDRHIKTIAYATKWQSLLLTSIPFRVRSPACRFEAANRRLPVAAEKSFDKSCSQGSRASRRNPRASYLSVNVRMM